MLAERTTSNDIAKVASEYVNEIWLERDLQEVRQMAAWQVEVLENDYRYREYMLPKTGFNMKTQMSLWAGDVIEGLNEGKSFIESNKDAMSKLAQDVEAFYREYLDRSPILPVRVGLSEINGRTRLVAGQYGEVPYGSIVAEEERDGASSEGLFKLIDFLEQCEPGMAAVITSPPGWSGFEDEYKETQTYVFQKRGISEVEAITIRSSMSVEQNALLIEQIGKLKLVRHDKDSENIKEIVSNPAFFVSNDGIGDVARVIGEGLGKGVYFFDESTEKYWFYNEVISQIEGRDTIFELDQDVQEVVLRLWNYAQNINDVSPESVAGLSVEVGRSILEVADIVRNRNTASKIYSGGSALSHIQRMGGCAGGGMGSLRRRLGSGEKKLIYRCGNCGRELKMFMRAGDECPHCHGVYLGC